MNRDHWTVRIWNDGKYFDLWHLNHFLAGVLLASAGILVDMDFWLNLVISIILMFSWEIFEVIKQIEETLFNATFDIIFGIVGYFLIYSINWQGDILQYVFYAILVCWFFFEIWGYFAYQIRGGNKKWRTEKI